MNKKVSSYFFIILLLLLAGAIGYYVGSGKMIFSNLFPSKSYTSMDKLEGTLQLIDRHYVDSVSTEELVGDLIPKLINQLDPHSTYLTKEQKDRERESLGGFFYGIGVTFNTIKDTAIVVSVIPNGPSDIVGIRPGDRILKADEYDLTQNLPADSIRNILRGEEGSTVKLEIRHQAGPETQTIKVRRGLVGVRQVEAQFLLNDSLGYIRLDNFSSNTYNDFMQAIAGQKAEGAKGLVLDLRNNPGGVMQSAILISNELLPLKSLIIYVEGEHYERQEIYSDGRGSLIGFPLYVLVNEASASAAEIVSGAVQDNDAGIIIGRRTFGKGLVQKSFEYYDGSSVNLTVAHYYTPSGRSIQRKYTLGEDSEYANDWYERYKSGEFFHQDSIHFNSSLLATTKGGRKVYGGGGITPDVFVPNDTTGYTNYYMQALSSGLIHEFSFIYADKYRNLLERLGSYEQCYKFLKNQGIAWQFANYAQRKGMRIRNYQVYLSEKKLEQTLSPLIIENIYGSDGAWWARTQEDEMVAIAVRYFSEKIYSPFSIPEEESFHPENSIIEITEIGNVPE